MMPLWSDGTYSSSRGREAYVHLALPPHLHVSRRNPHNGTASPPPQVRPVPSLAAVTLREWTPDFAFV